MIYLTNIISILTGISKDLEDIGNYTALYAYDGLLGALVAPIIGFITDQIIKFKQKDFITSLDLKVGELHSFLFPLLLTTFCAISLIICFLFFNPVATYVSLASLAVCRSCILSVGTAFLRARFPVEHLDRMLGIYGTVNCIGLLLLYINLELLMLHFKSTLLVDIALISLILSLPAHLLHKQGIREALLSERYGEFCDQEKKDPT